MAFNKTKSVDITFSPYRFRVSINIREDGIRLTATDITTTPDKPIPMGHTEYPAPQDTSEDHLQSSLDKFGKDTAMGFIFQLLNQLDTQEGESNADSI